MSIVRALREIAPQRLAVKTEEDVSDLERRDALRHQCEMAAWCQPIADLAGSRWPAKAVDISTGSVSLVLSRRFEPGTLVAIGLQGSLDDTMPLARVQRVAPDGLYWRIGCVWVDPMSADELRGLVPDLKS